jgi:hypothetical protein
MIRRLAAITLWWLLGSVVGAALFWALLQVPESSVWMLGLSVVLAVLACAVVMWTIGGALLAWQPTVVPGQAFRGGRRAWLAVLCGALILFLVWMLTAHATAWHLRHAGELDAWIIARSGKSDTAWLHRTIEWTIWVLRWGLGLTLAASLAAWMAADGVRAIGRLRWVTTALHPKRWLTVALIVGLLIQLPLQHAFWRPASLGINVEPLFVAVKLGVIAVLAAIGCVLVLWIATPAERPR